MLPRSSHSSGRSTRRIAGMFTMDILRTCFIINHDGHLYYIVGLFGAE